MFNKLKLSPPRFYLRSAFWLLTAALLLVGYKSNSYYQQQRVALTPFPPGVAAEANRADSAEEVAEQQQQIGRVSKSYASGYGAATPAMSAPTPAMRAPVLDLAFSPDSRHLAGGALDGTIHVWGIPNQPGHKLTGPRAAIRSVAFSPDGKTLGAATDQGVWLWDVASNTPRQLLAGYRVQKIFYTPDGDRLLAAIVLLADEDRKTGSQIVDVPITNDSQSDVQIRLELDGFLLDAALSPSGDKLATAVTPSADNTFGGVRLWITETWEGEGRLSPGRGSARALAFSPNGRLLAIGGGYLTPVREGSSRLVGELSVWELATGTQLHNLGESETGSYQSVGFSVDGNILAAGSAGPVETYKVGTGTGYRTTSQVHAWAVQTGEPLWKLRGPLGDMTSLAFSPDGKWMARCDGAEIILVDAQTGSLRRILMHGRNRIR